MEDKKESEDYRILNCLGFLYMHGIQVRRDQDMARRLFEKSAKLGDLTGAYIHMMK